MRDVEK